MELSFCLETLFPELPFIERPAAAKSCGVECIEFWDYRDKDLDALERALIVEQLRIVNFSGNRHHGMLDAAERSAFLDEVRAATVVAKRFRCPRLMLLVQPLSEDGAARPVPPGSSEGELFAALLQCGRELAALADQAAIDFVIEPLNTIVDHPGYFLHHSRTALQCIREIDHPRVKLLYDIYHMKTMGESIPADLQQHIDLIGYIHIADAPGRHEPGTGVIDYEGIFRLLKSLNYDRPIGFEFFPSIPDHSEVIEKTLERCR